MMLNVLLLALLPAAGNFTGAVAAELSPDEPAWRSWALHAAAGVVVAVLAVEVFPEALGVLQGWELAAAFVLGALTYLGVRRLLERNTGGGGGRGRMWGIYLAVTADLFGDGLLIGSGSSVSSGLGFALAMGQVLSDVPEGAASLATFRANGMSRARRLLVSASFVVPVLVGAAFSFAVLRERSEALQLAILVATAGIFFVAVFQDMLKEAHEAIEDSFASAAALVGGFALFLLISASLG